MKQPLTASQLIRILIACAIAYAIFHGVTTSHHEQTHVDRTFNCALYGPQRCGR